MNENPLGYVEVNKLIKKFAMPSVIGMLVTSIYNIVDQLFIGHAVGQLGNAATNVAFPLTFLTIALALLFGIGGAANFNLSLGQQKKECIHAACYERSDTSYNIKAISPSDADRLRITG